MTQQEKFIEYFIQSIYISMDLEDEAIFSKEEIYQRYKIFIDGMIQRGVHEHLTFKDYSHVQN